MSSPVIAQTNIKTVKLPTQSCKVPPQLVRQLLKDCVKDEVSFPEPHDPFSAHQIDLNNDGKPELVVTCNASATNWPMWIFSRQNNNFMQILKANVGIYGYNVLKSISNGYHDLQTIEHASAAEHEITTYKFDGHQYKQTGSYSEISKE